MTVLLVGIVTALYGAAAISFALQGRYEMAVVYAGYCVANFGLMAVDMKGTM